MLKLLSKWFIRLRGRPPELPPVEEDEHAYSEWEFNEGRRTWERFFAGRVDIEGKRVIDLGCGLGGKSAFYSTLGADEIVGVDILQDNIDKAVKYCEFKDFKLTRFQYADAAHLPFDDASFDIAISDDSFEHYPDPAGVISEAARVVKPAGLFVIDFTQWASPYGHHLQRWIKAPWAHLILTTDEIIAITREVGEKQIATVHNPRQREILLQKLDADLKHHQECLNRITISRFEKLVAESKKWISRYSRHTSAAPWLFPLKNITPLKEFVVGRNIYILERIKK